MKSRIGLTALLLNCIAVSPMSAQEADCTSISSIDQMAGSYSITNGPGQMINVPRSGAIPGPATATGTATLTRYGSRLGLDSAVFGTMVVDFEVVDDPDEKWNFGDSDVFETASSEDISIVTGCDSPEALMRLFGTGVTELPDVGERPVTMRLIVFPNGWLIGRMDVVMIAPDMTLQTRIQMEKTE